MRLLLCLQGVALLQLLHTYASVIQAHAVAAPQDTSTNFRNQPSLAVPPPNKRAWPDHRHTFFVVGQTVGLAWRLRFNVLEYARPLGGSSTVPANDLTMFYRATLAVARALWAPEEPQTLRTAIGNGLLLVFWSEQPIEWSFINAFMEHIIDRTRGGLVGGFDVTCVAESTGAVINVVLSIPGGVLQAAPAAKAKSS